MCQGYGKYCAFSDLTPKGGNGAATTLVIGDSYAEFSSSWGGDRGWGETPDPLLSESYFTSYCGGGSDNDNGLEKICNMGISGTTSESMDYTNARDNQWSWATVNADQQSLVTRSFDAAPRAKRVIYYISGNDYMYRGCQDSQAVLQGRILDSLVHVKDTAWHKNHLMPSDVTIISYAIPEESFKDSRTPITVTMPQNYERPKDGDGDDQDFTSVNVVTNNFIAKLKCDQSDSTCNKWQAGRVVSKIGGKTISEFGDHFGVRDYCAAAINGCKGVEVELDGGICTGAKLPEVMNTINEAIKGAAGQAGVNFVDGRAIVEKAENLDNTQWSKTDSGDQANGFHYDRIHVNYRGNCQVAQSTSKDFAEHSFEHAMNQASHFSLYKGKQFTCAKQVDCSETGTWSPDLVSGSFRLYRPIPPRRSHLTTILKVACVCKFDAYAIILFNQIIDSNLLT